MSKTPSKQPPAGEVRRRVRRDPEVARAAILAAAREVVAELGPDQAGLKQVAKAAGVSHGLVTHYFGTFSALVDEVLESQMVGMKDSIVKHVIEAGELEIGGVIRAVFQELRVPTNGRLMTWAFLTGRMETMTAFVERNQGLRVVSEAFLERPEANTTGLDKAELNQIMVMVWCALASYAVAGPTLWKALGEEVSEEQDEAYLSMLTELVLHRIKSSSRKD